MINVIPFDTLGQFQNDWLAARYHFSFANHHHPDRNGFGPLLVWNDDAIQPGTGFPRHGHRDMEIITYVREGAITHEDHLGNQGRTMAGDIQVMSAGKGILHAEFNRESEVTRIFQIWIMPDAAGHPPRWETRAFPKGEAAGRLVTLASGREADKDTGALWINQDAALIGATLPEGATAAYDIESGRRAYLVVAKGRLRVNGVEVGERDGATIEGVDRVEIVAAADAEVLIADLP
jgi:redox-sensitive bicupin YhaK (pirin superfamily)